MFTVALFTVTSYEIRIAVYLPMDDVMIVNLIAHVINWEAHLWGIVA